MDTTIKLLSDVFDGTSIRTKDDLDELSLKRKRELRGELVDAMEELDAELRDEHDPQKQDKFRAASRLVDRLNRDAEVRNYSGNSFPGGGENTPPGGGPSGSGRDGVEQWKDRKTGATVPVYRSGTPVGHDLDPGSEFRDLSLGQYLRSLINGPESDLERRALQESGAAGAAVPTVLAGRVIDALSANSVVRKAGARVAPIGQTDRVTIAKWDELPSGAWRDEGEAAATDSPSMTSVTLEPKSYAIIVKASRELVDDSKNLEASLEKQFGAKLGNVIDEAALVGSGASDPTGITNTSGIKSYSHAGKVSDWSPFAQGIEKVHLANAGDPDVGVVNPKIWSQFTTEMVDSNGQPLRRPTTLENLRLMQTTTCTATKMVLGDYTNVILGIRQDGNRVEVLRERYVDDLLVGLLVHLRMDVALEHPEGFCVVDSLTT